MTESLEIPRINPGTRKEIYIKYDSMCFCCRSKDNLNIHHRKPLSASGNNSVENLILLCEECHRKQHKAMNSTNGCVKQTYYIKKDLLRKLQNYAYWERIDITEAFNNVLNIGLKYKITLDKEK